MTLRMICLSVVAFLLITAGCQTAPQPQPKTDAAADLNAIKALSDQFLAAFNSADAAAMAALYAEDAIMMDPDQPAIEGRPAIQAAYESRIKESAGKVSYSAAHTSLETQVAGDWAFDRGNYTVTVTPKSGTPSELSFKYITICKRQPDGSWRIYRDISNGNTPPPSSSEQKK